MSVKAHQHRDHHGKRHGPAERVQVAARVAGGKSDGDEDDDQRKRRRHHRQHDFLGRFDGRLLRLVVLFLDVAHDVFQNHDGVVDDDAHGQRQPQQRHVVQREIHDLEQRERGDDGGGNGQRRNQHRAKIADEQQHHQARQQAAEQQMFLQRLNRSLDERGVVADDLDADPRRQRPLDLREFRLGRLDDLQRVASRLALQAEHDGFFAVEQVPGGRIG